MVILISWTIEFPLVINEQLGWSLFVLPAQHYISAFGPFLAAISTMFIFGGFSGVKSFFVARFFTRTSLLWYLFALGVPIAFFMISLFIQNIITGHGGLVELPWIEWLGIWLLWIFTFGIGEETGWRGFVLPEFQMKYSPMLAAFFVAVFWALWHLPYFFEDHGFMGMSALMIAGWFLGLVFGSLLLSWMFNKSGQNAWIPALWHGTYNTVLQFSSVDSWIPSLVTAMVIIFTSFVVIPRMKKKARVD
ncbi:MAG TPA: hypothetical protein DDY49_08015 [Paenibacillaceae bacterium]|nr:hypothetical protein [Paenibacillaceae bacterium]